MRRRLAALTAVPLLMLGAAACGDGSGADEPSGNAGVTGPIDGLEVTGEFGQAPEVTVDTPLQVEVTQREVIIEGDGPTVGEGGLASLHLQVVSGKTGEQAIGTFAQGKPLTGAMNEGEIFPAVLDGVVGMPVGSRIAVASTPEDAFGEAGAQQYGITAEETVVFVIDIMSVPLDGPEGTEVEPPADAPTIVTDERGDIERVDFEGAAAKPSGELQVIPLVEGEGNPIEAGDSVLMDYVGQVYGSDKPFNNTYPSSPVPFTIGAGQLIEGWDVGLEGVKEGSRVMLVIPPDLGYGKAGNPSIDVSGTDTLVFVVDVLGVE